MKKLLGVNPIPDGGFCYNDPIAIDAIDAILAAGIRVPQDILEAKTPPQPKSIMLEPSVLVRESTHRNAGAAHGDSGIHVEGAFRTQPAVKSPRGRIREPRNP